MIEQFFTRHDTQILIQHIDIKKKILHGSYRSSHDFDFIRDIKHPGLDRPQFDLAVFRYQDLALGAPLDRCPPSHSTSLKRQTHEQYQGKTNEKFFR